MARGSASDLLDQLARLELLAPFQVEQARNDVATGCADAPALAAALVRRKWLTPFQANKLSQGKAEELVVGPYRLLDRLGEGGMGQVFKARHARMDRVVALKVVNRERLTSPTAVERFLREVKAVSQLQHPNIVLAYDYGDDGGRHYYAMEYVQGHDLAQLVKERGPLPVREACDYVRQAALGLQHAHERGLVHRDLKPANLLLNDGTAPTTHHSPLTTHQVKILDFGLARFASETRSAGNLTQLGQIVGTVDYISPEQASDPRRADIRSDIYSLGCCLFYLLTGRPPFEGPDVVARIAARVLGDPPTLRAHRPDAPAALERVLARMLARDPQQRHATPAEVAAALESFARSRAEFAVAMPVAVAVTPAVDVERIQLQAVAAAPVSAPTTEVFQVVPTAVALTSRRSATAGSGNWVLVAAACAAVVLIGGTGGYWIFRQHKEEPPNKTSPQPLAVNDPNPRVRPPERTGDSEPVVERKADQQAPDATSSRDPEPGPAPPPMPVSKPDPAPEPKVVAGPELVPPPQPVVETASEPVGPKPMAEPAKPKDPRRPVPDAPAVAKAEAAIRDLYKDDYKKVRHSELTSFAERLLEAAENVTDDDVTLYVLTCEARDVAARAADATLAFKAIDDLAARFAVDGRTMKIAALERAIREAHTPERSLLHADIAKGLTEEAASADRFGEAVRLARLAENAALRSGDRALVTSTMTRRTDLESLQRAFENVKPAAAVLADKPDDPSANLAMGRFLCLQKGDWTQGLPHLVQGSDERLKELAGRELGGIANAEQEAELAEAWREQARKERGMASTQMLLHAQAMLQKTLPDLAGAAKLKAEKSLASIEKELPSGYVPEPPGARFKGHWLVPFSNRIIREYVIDAKGTVNFLREGQVLNGKIVNPREVKRSAKVTKQGNDYLLDFEDGALERLSMKGGNLVVERFEIKAQYPKGRPSLTATSVRKP